MRTARSLRHWLLSGLVLLNLSMITSLTAQAQSEDADELIPIEQADQAAYDIITEQLSEAEDPKVRKNLLLLRHAANLELEAYEAALNDIKAAIAEDVPFDFRGFNAKNELYGFVRKAEIPLEVRQSGAYHLEQIERADDEYFSMSWDLLASAFIDTQLYEKAEEYLRLELSADYITTMKRPVELYLTLGKLSKTEAQEVLLETYPELLNYLPSETNDAVVYELDGWGFEGGTLAGVGFHLWSVPLELYDQCQPIDCTIRFNTTAAGEIKNLKTLKGCPRPISREIKQSSQYFWQVGSRRGKPPLENLARKGLTFDYHLRPPATCAEQR